MGTSMRLRGEICVGIASLMSFTTLMLLIFVHVGQINTTHVPQMIAMVNINVASYGAALYDALFDPIQGLYTNDSSAPLQQGLGLRQYYEFGLYGYCGYINSTAGTCSNQTAGSEFRPYDALASDMIANFSSITTVVLQVSNTTLTDSKYLGQSSNAAYWMLLLGTILTAVTFFAGLLKHNVTFLLSGFSSIASALLLLIGASIWTIMINKCEAINSITVGSNPAPLGIVVSSGTGLTLAWAAFICSFISVIPYMISCFTYRG